MTTRRSLLRLAVGAGGVVALGASTAASAAQVPGATAPRGRRYLPPATGPWATVDPAAAGWDVDALAAAADLAGRRGSRALLVVDGGRIVAERYWHGTDPGVVLDVASVQKSVVAMLFGAVAATTALRAGDRVSRWLGAGWSAAGRAEAAVTCEHLLTMTSGLDEGLRAVARPGTVWSYNTPAYAVLHDVLTAATGRSLQDLSRDTLFAPVGATATWRTRRNPDGNAEQGLFASARDLARLGLLVLAAGRWGRRRILPVGWRATTLTPCRRANPAYGRLWWLNGPDTHLLPGDTAPRTGPLIPTAPRDLVAGLGARGQKLFVVPSRDLVVVRLGADPRERQDFNNDLWAALTPALPASRPGPG